MHFQAMMLVNRSAGSLLCGVRTTSIELKDDYIPLVDVRERPFPLHSCF